MYPGVVLIGFRRDGVRDASASKGAFWLEKMVIFFPDKMRMKQ